MVFRVSSSKIAAVASTKALARRAGRGRAASALQVTTYSDQNTASAKPQRQRWRTHRAKQASYHNLALVLPSKDIGVEIAAVGSPAASSDGTAGAIDKYLGSLLDDLDSGSSNGVDMPQQQSSEAHIRSNRVVDAKTAADMLMLRKELLLLHQLLDTLH
ncbi:MAG: hypothetical protein SGARI_000258 [Bacillariaceae sp.]